MNPLDGSGCPLVRFQEALDHAVKSYAHVGKHSEEEIVHAAEKQVDCVMADLKELNNPAFEELHPLWTEFKSHAKEIARNEGLEGVRFKADHIIQAIQKHSSPESGFEETKSRRNSPDPVVEARVAGNLIGYMAKLVRKNPLEIEESHMATSVRSIFEHIKNASEEERYLLTKDLLEVLSPLQNAQSHNVPLKRVLLEELSQLLESSPDQIKHESSAKASPLLNFLTGLAFRSQTKNPEITKEAVYMIARAINKLPLSDQAAPLRYFKMILPSLAGMIESALRSA